MITKIKTTCSKCGGPLEENRIGKQRYCRGCHAAQMRRTRPKHSDLHEEARRKANVRAISKYLLNTGKIVKESCTVCGSSESEMHHEDYSDPLKVVWLCRNHHLEAHGFPQETFHEEHHPSTL